MSDVKKGTASVAAPDANAQERQLLASVILDRAADKLRPRGAWTQEVSARDAHGNEVAEEDPAAVCWCASGAIYSQRAPACVTAAQLLEDVVGSIPEWNDTPSRRKGQVIAGLREAADLARSEGQ